VRKFTCCLFSALMVVLIQGLVAPDLTLKWVRGSSVSLLARVRDVLLENRSSVSGGGIFFTALSKVTECDAV